jgi:hypothetical protein
VVDASRRPGASLALVQRRRVGVSDRAPHGSDVPRREAEGRHGPVVERPSVDSESSVQSELSRIAATASGLVSVTATYSSKSPVLPVHDDERGHRPLLA